MGWAQGSPVGERDEERVDREEGDDLVWVRVRVRVRVRARVRGRVRVYRPRAP